MRTHDDARGRRALRLLPFVLAILAGIALIAVPLGTSQLTASTAGDTLVQDASPVLTRSSLQQMRAELTQLEGTSTALRDVGIPRLGALSGQTTQVFLADLAATDPAVSRGLAQLPAVQAQAEKIVTNLEHRRGQFESAAALPAPGVSLYQGVWLGIAAGAVLVVVGVVGFTRPRRSLAILVGAAGLALLVAPLALGYPSKTSATDSLLDSLRPFSIQKVQARQAGLATARTVFNGLQNDVVPGVAARAGTTPAVVAADLGAADPRLSPAGRQQTEAVLNRFGFLVDFSARIQPLLVDATSMPASAVTWVLLAPGIVLVLGVGLAWRQYR